MIEIACVNVNGIRASWRKGMAPWLEEAAPDVLTLQEVRADNAILEGIFAETGYLMHGAESDQKGRAGVALGARVAPVEVRTGFPDGSFATDGRWLEADYRLQDGGILTVVSAYVHSGEVGTPRQEAKYRFMDAMIERLPQLAEHSPYAVITGDLNVGHTTLDIKNWKGNVKKAGFLPEERAYFDRFFGELGWVDVARSLAGEVEGPYTWWSMRGQAFDNNTGWRIDYHAATPALAALARDSQVDRAPSYAERWSDHAPLRVRYELPALAVS